MKTIPMVAESHIYTFEEVRTAGAGRIHFEFAGHTVKSIQGGKFFLIKQDGESKQYVLKVGSCVVFHAGTTRIVKQEPFYNKNIMYADDAYQPEQNSVLIYTLGDVLTSGTQLNRNKTILFGPYSFKFVADGTYKLEGVSDGVSYLMKDTRFVLIKDEKTQRITRLCLHIEAVRAIYGVT